MSEADLLWYNGSTGETQVWYMRGDTVVNRGLVVDESGAVAPSVPHSASLGGRYGWRRERRHRLAQQPDG